MKHHKHRSGGCRKTMLESGHGPGHFHHEPDQLQRDPDEFVRFGGPGGGMVPGPGGMGYGAGGPGPGGPGPGGPGRGGPGGHGRRGRAGRGQIRAAVLLLLDEQPRHGYDLLAEITDRSEGRLSPSPGSIYPLLSRLSSAGMVTSEPGDGRKTYTLTDEGRAFVAEHRERWGTPWDSDGSGQPDEIARLRKGMHQVGMAVAQLSEVGTAEQLTRAEEVLTAARRDLYQLLAE